MIGKFMKSAKENYGVVKYENGYLVVSRTLPDFAIKSDCTFGDYKGSQILKPLDVKKAVNKVPDEILASFERVIKKQQEQYEELKKLKAPSLEQITKELKKEIKNYRINRFIHQYQDYYRALLAGAVEIALNEKVDLKGDITVGVIKFSSLPAKMVLKGIKKEEELTTEQKRKLKEIEEREYIQYVDINPQTKKLLKEFKKVSKRIKEGRTNEDKKILEQYQGKSPVNAKEETVNANKVKENIKQDMSEIKAWLCLLTAWCDVKGRVSPLNMKIPSIIYRGIPKIKLNAPLQVEEKGMLVGEIINEIKNSKPTTYEYSALFDILARMYAQGELDKTNGVFAVVKGKMSKSQMDEIRNLGAFIIDSNTIYRLLGSKDVRFAKNVKDALWTIDNLRYYLVGLSGRDDVARLYKFVYPWRPPEGMPDEVKYLYADKARRIFEIRKDLFEIYKEKNKVTYALIDNASFYRITKAGQRLKVGPRTISDSVNLWLYIIKTAGAKPTGERTAFVSFQGKGFIEPTKKHFTQREMKTRIEKPLKILAEAGLIASYMPLKNKKEFLIDVGG